MGKGTKRLVVAVVVTVVTLALAVAALAIRGVGPQPPKVEIPNTYADLYGMPSSFADAGGHTVLTWQERREAFRLADAQDHAVGYMWFRQGKTTVAAPDGTLLGTVTKGPDGMLVKDGLGKVVMRLVRAGGAVRITDGQGAVLGRLDADGLTLGKARYHLQRHSDAPAAKLLRDGKVAFQLALVMPQSQYLLLGLTDLPLRLRVALEFEASLRGL